MRKEAGMTDEIIMLFEQGWNIEDIADELGVCDTYVSDVLEEAGVL